jgi:hypothetical protein
MIFVFVPKGENGENNCYIIAPAGELTHGL